MADSESHCAGCDQQRPASAVPSESPLDPATFVAPTALASPRIVIEFCNRVRMRNNYSRDLVVIRPCSVDGEAISFFVAAVALSSGTGFTERNGWRRNFS